MTETSTAEARSPDADVADPKSLGGLSPELLRELLREMLLYRRFEEKAEEAYAIGKIGGFCHLHIGQEAAAAGTIKALREDDYVITAYRDHTQAIAKGVDPNAVMAELFGRATGASGGKGGSMHIFDAAKGFFGGHGIVGQQVALATGLGWAASYRGEDRVVLCFMGDAAVNQGAFHESLNMAAIWNLPVIYVVENNAYGMGTAFSRVSKTDMTTKALPYGIETLKVDGQDVVATYTAFRALIEEVRSGGGPRFVDLVTYRFKGHSMSDPVSGTYRSKEEVEDKVRHDDPIRILSDRLKDAELLEQADLEAMDKDAKKRAEEAVEFAESSPVPGPEALYEHAYAQVNEHGRLFMDGRRRGEER